MKASPTSHAAAVATLSICAIAFMGTAAHGQIIWGAPQPYTATTADISLSGSFVAAVTENTSNTSVTVGDTTFDPVYDATITGLGGGGGDGSGSSATPYQEALNGCAYNWAPDTFSFTLNGLNAGDEYQVEIWNVANDTSRNTEYSSTGTGGTTSVDVENSFVLGTFSGVTSETVTCQGLGPPQTVPERSMPLHCEISAPFRNPPRGPPSHWALSS